MTNMQESPVGSGLDRVLETYHDLLPEHDGSTLWFHPSKNRSDLTRSFMCFYPRDGRCWVRCQGKGGTRPDYPGPAIADMTEEWVVRETTQFIETTLRDFGLKSDALGA